MILSVLNSSNSQALFGTPDTPTNSPCTIIAQKQDCSSFLILSKEANPALDPFVSFDGYDFTYCQAWGLTVNAAVVARTVLDLRAKAYPDPALLADGQAKQTSTDPIIQAYGTAQVAKYYADCLAVKANIPKGAW
jgi:hypothetical protein